MDTADITQLNPQNIESANSTWRDWVGIVASIGCAIHCAAMPFVIAYLPAMGLSFLADEAFHKWMALVCFLIAIAAFVPGIRKHGNWLPVSVGGLGLAVITYAAFGLAGQCCPSCESSATDQTAVNIDTDTCEGCENCESCGDETNSSTSLVSIASDTNPTSAADKPLLSILAPWMTPFGGCLLVAAHLLNRRFGCLCACCRP